MDSFVDSVAFVVQIFILQHSCSSNACFGASSPSDRIDPTDFNLLCFVMLCRILLPYRSLGAFAVLIYTNSKCFFDSLR